MSELFIPLLLGTARIGRESEKAAHYVLEQLRNVDGVRTELIDPRDYLVSRTVPAWEKAEDAPSWSATMEKADGLLIVAPEYNRGYTGELKMMLDQLPAKFTERKPVALCGVSSGALGGVAMIEAIANVLLKMRFVPTAYPVYFSTVESLFDESGKITTADYESRLDKLFTELLWYARVLKAGREDF